MGSNFLLKRLSNKVQFSLQLQDTTLECGYTLNTSMIPYFVPLSLAQEILFIGKTIILFGFDPKKEKKNSSFVASRTLMPLQKCGVESRR